MDNGVRKVRSF